MNETQKILIVDDKKENLVILRRVLRDLDAEIVEATNGNQALAATLDHEFAMAILDVMMPGMDGFELATHLRGDEKTRTIPLVFVTASSADEHKMFEGYDVGGIDYIMKPYNPLILLGKVRIFLELDRHKRELQRHRDHLAALVADGTAQLTERMKEISCLNNVLGLAASPRASIHETLRRAVDLIPPGLQYPDICGARITFAEHAYTTANFKETEWKKSEDITLLDQAVGAVEICYLKEVSTPSGGPFLEEECRMLSDIARQLGVAIARARAESKLQETNTRLEEVLRGTMDVIQQLTEARDPYTAGHQRRVADLTAAIGREMLLPEESCVSPMYTAALIHDIGKIAVPIEILSRPGRLTDAEFQLIREHAQRGYDILKRARLPYPVPEVVLQHHERLDGSGYPQGLANDDILPEAQILAVADVVEAMSSHRPYRPSLGVDAALAEVVAGAGTRYYRDVVDACVSVFVDKGFAFAAP